MNPRRSRGHFGSSGKYAATASLKGASTGEDLRQTLRILGSTASSELMALEVIWQPEGRGDVLSAEELLTAYPNLQHL